MIHQPDTVRLGLPPEAAPVIAARRPRLQHIAVVLGGHRSWSARHQQPVGTALSRALTNLLEIVHYCISRKGRRLTLFIFCDDVWPSSSRHNRDVAALTLRFLKITLTTLNAKGVRIVIAGDASRLPEPIRGLARQAQALTADNNGMELVIAVDGQQFSPDEATPSDPCRPRLCAPELVIRTGGHLPVDHPMLWDTSETSLYVTEAYWPDLTLGTFRAALEWFRRPDRGHCSVRPSLN